MISITLEDIEEIKKLKAKYCYYVDERRLDDLMNLFAEEVYADFGPFGKVEGKKENLRKWFEEVAFPTFLFFVHMVQNPIIEVEKDKAKGTWYFEVPATLKGNIQVWIAGRYDEEYVKVGGRWLIKTLKCSFFYITPYEEGWMKRKMITVPG